MAKAAAELVMRGGLAYLATTPQYQAITGSARGVDMLVAAFKVAAPAALPVALDEARAAFEAHMPQVAEATFKAAMTLAGIAAAQQVEGDF